MGYMVLTGGLGQKALCGDNDTDWAEADIAALEDFRRYLHAAVQLKPQSDIR